MDDVEFSSLKEFCIADCPQLVEFIPFHVSSLRLFKIEGLPNLRCNQEGLLPYGSSVQEAYIRGCPSMSLLHVSPALKELVIGECKHLEFPTVASSNSSLERLEMFNFGNSIEAIPLFSFSKLQYMYIERWASPKLFELPNGHHQNHVALQELTISCCNNIVCFPEVGLPTPNLKTLTLYSCEKLKSLPEQMATQLSSLSDLTIRDCPDLECFPEGGLPHSLEALDISSCEKLMSCKSNWGLQRLPSLIQLFMRGDKDELFPEEGFLPRGLQVLDIREYPNLEALNHKALQHLTSLQSLEIWTCPNLKALNQKSLQHLTSLESLAIKNCINLESLDDKGLQHLTSLRSLVIKSARI